MRNLVDGFSFRTSKPEEMCKRGFERFGLSPEHNYQVDFFYIDFAFPELKVGLEIDSYAWHKDDDKDMRRHKYITGKGWKLHHVMAKLVYQNQLLPAAYLYLKYFGQDKQLAASAKYEIYKTFRHVLSDRERDFQLKDILNHEK